MSHFTLPDRGVVAVDGPDAVEFLQGLVTSDVAGLAQSQARYAALLTPQGKILFDFLIVRVAAGFYLDVAGSLSADLAKRLKFYKLRAKVDVRDRSDELAVVTADGPPGAAEAVRFRDPRHEGLGVCAILSRTEQLPPDGTSAFAARRIALGVPEGGIDFAYGDAFPHDANLDDLAGVDFDKGCYVGQEVVSRMKHRGTARRRIVTVTGDAPLPATGAEITAGGKAIGTLGSTDGNRGLAMVRIDRAKAAIDDGSEILAGVGPIRLALPSYARFGWPSGAQSDI